MAIGVQDEEGAKRGRRGRRRRRPLAEINVTPLVDVMLVLLIVFMVTAPLLTTGVAVDLPRAESSPLPGQDEPLSVTIDAQGRIFLQDSEIALDQLGPRLQAIAGRKPDARIFVRGDQAIDYGVVMAAVSAINQAGFGKVALLTEAPSATGRATAPGTVATRRP
jgi:biopolymer transport protein TolR